MKENLQMRVDINFKKQVSDISIERIKNGMDKKMRSFSRITKAIIRLPSWKKMKEKLIEANFIENKKGQTTEVITFIIVAFISVLFIGLWIYAFGLISDSFIGLNTFAGDVNLSEAAQNTFGQLNDAFKTQADYLALAILFGMILEIFIMNYFTRSHPILFLVHLILTIVAIILSVYLSNIYETLLVGQPFSTVLISNMRITSSIMLNLPIWATVVGLLGGVFLVIGYVRREKTIM